MNVEGGLGAEDASGVGGEEGGGAEDCAGAFEGDGEAYAGAVVDCLWGGGVGVRGGRSEGGGGQS